MKCLIIFNKHFTRRQTLIACDLRSKVVFYILSLTIIFMYCTEPYGFSFLFCKLYNKSQRDNNTYISK